MPSFINASCHFTIINSQMHTCTKMYHIPFKIYARQPDKVLVYGAPSHFLEPFHPVDINSIRLQEQEKKLKCMVVILGTFLSSTRLRDLTKFW